MGRRSSSIGTKRISATWLVTAFFRKRRSRSSSMIRWTLEWSIVEGEERYLNLGATVQGRILLVVTTWREDRVRVVTAFRTNQTAHSVLLPGTREVIPMAKKQPPFKTEAQEAEWWAKNQNSYRGTASSKPKPLANSAREPWRELPANGPAKPELRQRSQSGWRKMTSREPEPSPPRRGCGTRRTSKCCCTKL